MSKVETYASVWDAIADTPDEAANLIARAELMPKIAATIETTQMDAEKRQGTGVTSMSLKIPSEVAA